jgi:hypothetical protein
MTEVDSKRLQRIDNNVQLIADILVSVVAFALALCVAELIDNFSYWSGRAHSWTGAIALGVTFAAGSAVGRFLIDR